MMQRLISSQVKAKYYSELVDLVAQHTGSSHVFLENHIIREEAGDNGGPVATSTLRLQFFRKIDPDLALFLGPFFEG